MVRTSQAVKVGVAVLVMVALGVLFTSQPAVKRQRSRIVVPGLRTDHARHNSLSPVREPWRPPLQRLPTRSTAPRPLSVIDPFAGTASGAPPPAAPAVVPPAATPPAPAPAPGAAVPAPAPAPAPTPAPAPAAEDDDDFKPKLHLGNLGGGGLGGGGLKGFAALPDDFTARLKAAREEGSDGSADGDDDPRVGRDLETDDSSGSGSANGEQSGEGSASKAVAVLPFGVRADSLEAKDPRVLLAEGVDDDEAAYCRSHPFDHDRCFKVLLKIMHSHARERQLKGGRKKMTLRNGLNVDETFADDIMDCASYHIGRILHIPQLTPCVIVSWNLDQLKEQYDPWFKSRSWTEQKMADWYSDKHAGNKRLKMSRKDNYLQLKRRVWFDKLQNRKREGVDKGWMPDCNPDTFDSRPSDKCITVAGDIMNLFVLDYIIDNHDRPGNCVAVNNRVVAFDQSNGNFEMQPPPKRMQSPHLRIRPDIEARPITPKQKPACTFECGMVEHLWSLKLGDKALFEMVHESMLEDPDALLPTSTMSDFLSDRARMKALDHRLDSLLGFVDRCISMFGREHTLFGKCPTLERTGNAALRPYMDKSIAPPPTKAVATRSGSGSSSDASASGSGSDAGSNAGSGPAPVVEETHADGSL